MTSRVGTVLILVLWCASWALIYIHGLLFLVGVVVGATLIYGSLFNRHYAYGYRYISQRTRIFLPVTRHETRRNKRIRLERRVDALDEKRRACQWMIEGAKEEYERLRIPILEAERDAAEREKERVKEDIVRLKEAWGREDRERAYRKLTA